MKFLKSLFSKNQSLLPDKSGADGTQKDPDYSDKRRAPRIRLSPLHACYFIRNDMPQNLPEDARILLSNLSSFGAGFLKNSAPTWPSPGALPGALIEGQLYLSGQSIPMGLKVIYITQTVVGAQICSSHQNYIYHLNQYFRLELGALGMTELKSEFLKPESDGIPHLYMGRNNCELFYVSRLTKSDGVEAEEFIRFYLSFFANYIEGSNQGSTKFGELMEDAKEKSEYKGTNLVKWNASLAPILKETTIKFLENVPKLNPAAKDWIIQRIET